MNEPDPTGVSPDAETSATAEQAAVLQYLGLASVGAMTQPQARALISRSEADPALREKLRSWHREKYRLHPDLFAPPQRSFRDARWWQARISPETLYGYSFQPPSLDQTFVILDALDRREPGWDQETGPRREARFMNELATLSPELCKPGCVFPHDLPAEDAPEEPPPAVPAFRAPSAPFVPDGYGAVSAPPPAFSKPAWNPPVQPPTQFQKADQAATARSGGGGKWFLLLFVLVAGVGAYVYLQFHAPAPVRDGASAPTDESRAGDRSTSTSTFAPVPALESRQRAIARHPDLGKAGTPLNLKFVAAYRKLEAEGSPRLQQPDWPERLADECAGVSSPAPGSASPAPAVKPAPTTAPAAANPSAPAVRSPAAATPVPPESMFVNLEASYKDKLNTVKYRQHGASQEAGVAVDLHNMARAPVKLLLRCVFFKRPNGRGDLRSVLSKEEKHVELAAGQTYADAFDSPPVYRGRGATEEFDGWLVQIIPEGSDKPFKQIGSTGTIEELGKRMKF